MQNTTKKAILGFLGILILSASIVTGVTLVGRQQIFSGKAAESTTAEKIAEIVGEIGQTAQPDHVQSYASASLGYNLNFDKNYWTPIQNTDLTIPDQKVLSFGLKTTSGIATLEFNTFNGTELRSRIDNEKSVNPEVQGDDLDILAANIARRFPPARKERVRRNGRDYYRFVYVTEFLNQQVGYYNYITINENKFYLITVKYPSFGNSPELTEDLVDSITFSQQGPNVKGASVAEVPQTVLDETKIVELTKPSVVEVAHLYCNNITIPDTSGLRYLKSAYKFCDGALGSGFVMNESGGIATNGHVVKQYPDAALVQSLLNSNPFAQQFFIDLIRELVLLQQGQEISETQAKTLLSQAKIDPTYFESFVVLLYKMIQENIMKVAADQDKFIVKLANDPIVIDPDLARNDFINAIGTSETIRLAELVAYNYPNPISVDAVLSGKRETGSDVAILKVTDPGGLVFPSLALGTSEGLKEGSPVIVIGYPGLVAGGADSIVNAKSSATPTITKGIISAIKADQAGLKLIQVDASIDHGNSGGPAINEKGEVIGIATYGIGSQSGNYNFLRDIEDLKKLAQENSMTIAPSATYIEWAQGLDYFWREHYKQAVLPFDKVEASYPIHPSVVGYVNDSQTAIQKGQDRSDFLFLIIHDRLTQIITGAILLVALAVWGGVAYYIKKRGPGSTNPLSPGTPLTEPAPQAPQPQSPVY